MTSVSNLNPSCIELEYGFGCDKEVSTKQNHPTKLSETPYIILFCKLIVHTKYQLSLINGSIMFGVGDLNSRLILVQLALY